jgi:hypothetical protein
MAMKIADIKERLLLARAAAMAAFQNGDRDEVIRRKEEMYALNQLPVTLRPGKVNHAARRAGRKPDVFDRVVKAMRADQARGENLEMKEEAMAKRYGASRETCRRARDHVLSSNVGN